MSDLSKSSALLLAGAQSPSPSKNEATVIFTRWWILSLFSLFTASQGLIWTLPGVLQTNMMIVYGLEGETLQLFLAYGAALSVLFSPTFSYYLDRYGSRVPFLVSYFFCFSSCLLRCFATDGSTLSVGLLHVSFLLNGLAGPVALGAVGKISEDWFPANQRSLSTAIMSQANLFGGSICYILAPAVVPDPERSELVLLSIILTVATGLPFLAAMIYFPNYPGAAPTPSAALSKSQGGSITCRSLWETVRSLAALPSFLLLASAYSACNAMGSVWGALITTDLAAVQMSTEAAGLLAFTASVCGNVLGVAIGYVASTSRWQRPLLILILACGGLGFLLFGIIIQRSPALVTEAFASSTSGTSLLYIGALVGDGAVTASIPLFYELIMDCTFPLPRATVLLVCTMMMNLFTVPPILIPTSSLGVDWINYAYASVVFASAGVLTAFFKNTEARSRYDEDKEGSNAQEGGDDEAQLLTGDIETTLSPESSRHLIVQ